MNKVQNNEMTSWVGWIAFASVILGVAGTFHIIAGLTALFKNTVYVVAENSIWALNYATWGWIHILWGIVVIAAAGSLMAGKGFGRIFAVVAAVVSLIANMLYIPIYPLWSLLIIAVDILVIYAVIVHGDEVREV